MDENVRQVNCEKGIALWRVWRKDVLDSTVGQVRETDQLFPKRLRGWCGKVEGKDRSRK